MILRRCSLSLLPRSLPVVLALLIAAPSAHAQAARFIPYQGHLEHNGEGVIDQVTVTFALYPAESGGSTLYSADQSVTPVSGSFSTRIGPVPDVVFESPALYLQLAVDGIELAGRQRIETAPYAIRGQPGLPFRTDALTLDDGLGVVTLLPSLAGDGVLLDNGAHDATLTPTADGLRVESLVASSVVLEGGIDTPRLAAVESIEHSNVNHFGSGSLSGTFSDPGGTIIILASASAFTQAGPGRISMRIEVDGFTIDSLRTYALRNNEHFAFPAAFIRLDRGNYPPGTPTNPIQRTVTLRPVDCSLGCGGNIVTAKADQNDYGNVMIIRLPTP